MDQYKDILIIAGIGAACITYLHANFISRKEINYIKELLQRLEKRIEKLSEELHK